MSPSQANQLELKPLRGATLQGKTHRRWPHWPGSGGVRWLGAALVLSIGCSTEPTDNTPPAVTQQCVPGATLPCACPIGQFAEQTCLPTGVGYTQCGPCQPPDIVPMGTGGVLAAGGSMASGGLLNPGGGQQATGGSAQGSGGLVNSGGVEVSGGVASTGGVTASGGMATTGGTTQTQPGVAGIPEAELDMLRQLCVDEINMYRATLSLGPMQRATPEQELCSDRGSKKDGDTRAAHSSAGAGNPCVDPSAPRWPPPFPNFSSQNTCPGWPVGGFNAPTIADALKGCLSQMWAEGEPPEGEEKCIADYFEGNTRCFLAHGHYLNMKGGSAGVSCGFYKMQNGAYWMNQDFF